MKPIKLKKTKEMNLDSFFLDYVSRNYGQQAVTQGLQSYFIDFNKNRNFFTLSRDECNTVKDLTTSLHLATNYLNQLVAIKSKMIFSPQTQNCNIDFTWTDTITDNTWASKNIEFEYYNVLFNIASLHFHIGYQKSNSKNINIDTRKEIVKDYKHSLYLFNIIRDEALHKIDRVELHFDLYPEYCEYCATLCVIYGQIEIVKIAEERTPKEFALRGKLLMGISENYNKAFLLSARDPISKGGKDSFRTYLSNRSYYYKSLALKKLSEINLANFDKTGLGYGEALVHQQLSVKELDECVKTINSCEGLIDVYQFNKVLEDEKKNRKKNG